MGGMREARFRTQSVPIGTEVVVKDRFIGSEIPRNDLARFNLSLGEDDPTPGEIGCLLSHICIWEHVSTQKEGTWFIVCEDDAVWNVGGIQIAMDIAHTLHDTATVDFVFLNRSDPVIPNGRVRKTNGDVVQTKLLGVQLFEPVALWGTAAYMLTPFAARCMLNNMRGEHGAYKWHAADDITWGSYFRMTPSELQVFKTRWKDHIDAGGFTTHINSSRLLENESRHTFKALATEHNVCSLRPVKSTTRPILSKKQSTQR